MTARAGLALLLMLIAAGCVEEKPPVSPHVAATQTAPDEEPAEPDFDADNLLNLAYGASVVSRTAELSLETSAVSAIDSSSSTYWSSPPGGASQTMVYAFAAPARVSRIGAATGKDAAQVAASLRFSWSLDGQSWQDAGTVNLQPTDTPQLIDVEPFTALYLRIEVVEPSDYFALIRSFHAIGREIEQPIPREFTGCWTINGVPAKLERRGAHVRGVIATTPPTFLEGGTDGRLARLTWKRGPMWGYELLTMTPDGNRLSGLDFHEGISIQQIGASLFGERCAGAGPEPEPGIAPSELMEGARQWTLFGLAFATDNTLVVEPSSAALDQLIAVAQSSPLRVVIREMREANPQLNRKKSEDKAVALRTALQQRGADLSRIEIVPVGDDWNGPPISVAIQRLLGSRIEVTRPAR